MFEDINSNITTKDERAEVQGEIYIPLLEGNIKVFTDRINDQVVTD